MELQSRPHKTIAELVGGILSDIRNLFSAEMKLAWAESQQAVRKAKRRAAAFVFALGLALLGTFLLLQMLVQLADVYFEFPLWAAYGVVGLLAIGMSALLLTVSKR
jgi:hypothetical protein